jgi:hypothetical protein
MKCKEMMPITILCLCGALANGYEPEGREFESPRAHQF